MLQHLPKKLSLSLQAVLTENLSLRGWVAFQQQEFLSRSSGGGADWAGGEGLLSASCLSVLTWLESLSGRLYPRGHSPEASAPSAITLELTHGSWTETGAFGLCRCPLHWFVSAYTSRVGRVLDCHRWLSICIRWFKGGCVEAVMARFVCHLLWLRSSLTRSSSPPCGL